MEFSAKGREALIGELGGARYDLVIVGGGITGAGIALDAASRGLKTLLIEKQDFAQGTSSRSTRLIHGGLRYLAQFKVALVAEVARERAIVRKNAPHLVIPQKMILPLIKGGSLNALGSFAGISMYDFLAKVKRVERKRMLSKAKTLKEEPGLNTDLLKSGASYYEYKTNDARLTIEIMKTAVAYGADTLNYFEAKDFLYRDGQICGVRGQDLLSGGDYDISASCVINAGGPWVDRIREMDFHQMNEALGREKTAFRPKKRLLLTKGIHIVMSREKIPVKNAVYFDTDDKRMIFVIPNEDKVYIGTTDTVYKDALEDPMVCDEDVDYLVANLGRMFPAYQVKKEDVEAAWAGLRPLIYEKGKDPSEVSRKDEISISESGLVSIAGGKLTAYRKMAEKTVNTIARKFSDRLPTLTKSGTRDIVLSGGKIKHDNDILRVVEYGDARYDEARQTGIDALSFRRLFYRYGSNIREITEKAFDLYNESKNQEDSWLRAEVRYCLGHEMLVKPDDFLTRRTENQYFHSEKTGEKAKVLCEEMQEYFSWDEQKKEEEYKSCVLP